MTECLICHSLFKGNHLLGVHLKKHSITFFEYKNRFNLWKRCTYPGCSKIVSRRCFSGLCLSHTKLGERNPFYGKKHSNEVLEKSKEHRSEASKKLWKTKEYRDKIVKAVSKPRREGFKKEQSERVSLWYKENPDQLIIRRDTMRKRWKEGKITLIPNKYNTSKVEIKLFEDIKEIAADAVVKKAIKLKKSWIIPDIYIPRLGLIIEMYGDFWHANPVLYGPEDLVHHGLKAKDIWEKDEGRERAINEQGLEMLVVWASDYKKRKNEVLSSLNASLNWELYEV
jgi:hypothetical protein